jgi:hypothetical protein
MTKLLTMAAAAVLLAACAGQTAKIEPSEENAASSIAAAEVANKEAAAIGFEWRDTAKIIKQAKEAAAKKEYAKSIELAQKAEHQGQNAVKQAASAYK